MSDFMDFDDVKILLRTHWNKAWTRETPLPVSPTRIEELHPSSFPFCGLRYATELVASEGDASTFNMSANMEYYCAVGTVAHLVFQKHMRLTKGNGRDNSVVIGDWTCPSCGYKNKFRPYHTCKKCKSPSITGEVGRLSGDEISVQLGSRTTGHADDVIKIDNRYWVIDYKTSSVRAVANYKRFNRGLPYKHNVSQIKSYAKLIERKYNIKISGWFLLYAARDTPMSEIAICGGEITDDIRETLNAELETADKMFETVRTYVAPAVNTGKPLLNGDKERIKKLSKRLIKNKLCSCEAHYSEDIKDQYDPCPLAESGICFKPDVLKRYTENVFLRVGQD